jgi:hypothetical protein
LVLCLVFEGKPNAEQDAEEQAEEIRELGEALTKNEKPHGVVDGMMSAFFKCFPLSV